MVTVRRAREEDLQGCYDVDCNVFAADYRAAFLRAHARSDRLFVAEADGRVVGFIAYETEWIGTTYISLVCVHSTYQRQGIARRLFQAVEAACTTDRLFSSAEEANSASIMMHEALGFQRSGYIENLPQPSREIIFFKKLEKRDAV